MDTTVQSARRADATALGQCIGDAFAQDPVSRWTFGDPEAIRAAYTVLAERLYVPAGHATMVPGCGGALWLAPNQPNKALGPMGVCSMAAQLVCTGGLRHVSRSVQVDRAMQRRRPTTPHHYIEWFRKVA